MKLLSHVIGPTTAFVFIYLPFPEAAESHYLETGGFIIPWIAAAFIGASVAVTLYWRKLKNIFNSRFRKGRNVNNDNSSIED